jgi:hypothetical protein
MTGLKRSLSAAVLLTLFISSANLVLSQSSPNDEDKIEKLGSHWKAELIGNPPPGFKLGIEKLTLGKSL